MSKNSIGVGVSVVIIASIVYSVVVLLYGCFNRADTFMASWGVIPIVFEYVALGILIGWGIISFILLITQVVLTKNEEKE